MFKSIKKSFAIIIAITAFIATVITIVQYYDTKKIINIEGNWKLNLVIKSTTHSKYKDMEIEYILYVNQDSKNIKGRGEKLVVNNKELPTTQRDEITFNGNINNDKVKLLFELHGKKRKTVGTFNLQATDDINIFKGSFNTTGASSKGTAIMEKIIDKSFD